MDAKQRNNFIFWLEHVVSEGDAWGDLLDPKRTRKGAAAHADSIVRVAERALLYMRAERGDFSKETYP